MKIGIVAEVDRSAGALHDVAEACGHALEIHNGVISSGAAASSLRALIGRVELVVVVTDVNSHTGVRAARPEARNRRRPVRNRPAHGHGAARRAAARPAEDFWMRGMVEGRRGGAG